MMKRYVRSLVLLLVALSTTFLHAEEWTAIGPMSGKFTSVEWKPDNGDIIYASYQNTLFKSEDHGETWGVAYGVSDGNNAFLNIRNLQFMPGNSETIFFAGNIAHDPNFAENGFYKSTDGGTTFTQTLTAPIEGYALHPTTGKIITFHGNDNYHNMRVSSDDGESWSTITGYPSRVENIAFDIADDNIIYATTYYGAYKSVDGGSNWELIGFEGMNLGLCVTHPENSGEVWIGSPFSGDEFLYRSFDGGENWEEIILPYTQGVADHPQYIAFGQDTDRIYIAEMNEIFVTDDNGENWETTSFDINSEYFYAMDIAINRNNDDEVIVPSDLLSKQTMNGGDDWEEFEITAGSTNVVETAINPEGGYYLYAGNPWGLNRYNSNADEWTDFTQPGYVGVEVKALAVDDDNPGLLLKGVRNALNNGVIYRSTDFGDTEVAVWDNMAEFGAFHTEITESPAVEDLFYAVTWQEGIPAQFMRSEDAGETWEVVDGSGAIHTKMTDIVIDHQNPDNLYIFGNGVVSKSVDGGETFNVSDNGLPYEGVYDGTINPYDGNILFASVTQGIYKTTDGGDNWFQVTNSDESAKHIEYNPVLPAMITAITFDEKIIQSKDNGETWVDITGDVVANFTDISYSPDGKLLFVSTTAQGVYKSEIDDSYLTPTNLFVSTSGFNVNLSWDEIPGVDGYSIYLDGVKVDESTTASYTDYYLSPGSYTYNVASIVSGVESSLSSNGYAYVGGSELDTPYNLSGSIENFRDVVLTWDEPTTGPLPQWIHYDNGEPAGSWSTMTGGTFDAVVKYSAEDLAEFDGLALTKINFVPASPAGNGDGHWAKVWVGDDLVVDEKLDDSALTTNEWNTYTLPIPIAIDPTKDLTFGIKVSAWFGNLFSYDAGPSTKPGYSDLIMMGTNEYTLADFGYDANNSIKGYVEPIENKNDRALTGYKVYKEGTLLSTIIGTDECTYTDAGLDWNSYHYAVTATYDDGESAPSNEAVVNLVDPFVAPHNLAYEIYNENDVVLSWEAPELSSNEDLQLSYCSGEYEGSWSTMTGGTFDVVSRFTSENLSEYEGMKLTEINFIPSSPAGNGDGHWARVWVGDELIVDEKLDDAALVMNEWNTYTLPTPIVIDSTQDLTFGIKVSAWFGDLFSFDAGPATNPGYSDLILMGTNEFTLVDFGYDANNNITGTILNEGGLEVPTLTGFTVYKNGDELATINNSEILGFTDGGVEFDFPHSYNVTALYENSEESILSDPVTLMIANPYLPPVNITGYSETNGNRVEWEMAEDIYKLHWDSGVSTDGVGLTNGGDIMAGIRFAPEHLPSSDNFQLRRVRFFPRAEYSTTIKIYRGELAEDLLYEEEVMTLTPMEWNEITLTTPVDVSNDDYLWITYLMEDTDAGTYPVGLDGGPAAEAFGDLVSTDGGETWSVLSYVGFNANINLQAEAVDSEGKVLTFGDRDYVESSTPFNSKLISKVDNRFSRSDERLKLDRDVVLVGFNIYRDGAILEEISGAEVRDYLDTNCLPGENHSYYLTAVYEGDIESPVSTSITFAPVSVDEVST